MLFCQPLPLPKFFWNLTVLQTQEWIQVVKTLILYGKNECPSLEWGALLVDLWRSLIFESRESKPVMRAESAKGCG